MKRIFVPIFSVIFLFSTSCVNAGTTHFNEKDEEKNHYTWNPTDESQERQAVGMVLWGISIAVAAAIISAIIPNSTAPKTTTGTASSGSGPLFPSGSGTSGAASSS